MDQSTQKTSFIPKTPVLPVSKKFRRKKHMSIYMLIALIIFVASVVSAVGVTLWKNTSIQKVKSLDSELKAQAAKFTQDDTDQLVKRLIVLDRRLKTADYILSTHTTLTPLFNFLSVDTLKSVRFSNANIEVPETGDVIVELSGQSTGFDELAKQSDNLGKSTEGGVNTFVGSLSSISAVKNLIFSDLGTDNEGKTTFNVSFSLDREHVLFENNLNVYPPSTRKKTYNPVSVNSEQNTLNAAEANTNSLRSSVLNSIISIFYE